MLTVTIIGCSGSYPGPDSACSCYLVEYQADGRTWRLLLDLGSGALGSLHRIVDPLKIDAVLLSHLHPDHCIDMCGYYVMRKYHPAGPAPRIPVWGPAGTAQRLALAYDLPLDPGMNEEFDFVSFDRPFQLGPIQVHPFEVRHPVPAYALRLEAGGRSLTYTGDTAWCDNLATAAAGVDLLLAEASFRADRDNPPGLHLTGLDCGRLAKQAGANRLVLTHIPPWHQREQMLLEAESSGYQGVLELALPEAVFQV